MNKHQIAVGDAMGNHLDRKKGIAIIEAAIEKAQSDDTKRLDWLEENTVMMWTIYSNRTQYGKVREAIDAAMRKEAK